MRWLVVVMLASCIDPSSVTCADGTTCPAGTVCATLAQNHELRCVPQAQVDACHDATVTTCTAGSAPGACYDADIGRVCLATGCGNGLVDPGEACDDGNAAVGDGCSVGCTSNETCGNGVVDPVKLDASVLVPNEQCDDANLVGHDGCASECRIETPEWLPLAAKLPDPRSGFGVAYDIARRRVVVFGGFQKQGNGGPMVLGDTWEFDGTGWMQIPTPIAPAARYGPVLAYDAARRRVVLFGGSTALGGFGAVRDTWSWDGTSWVELHPATVPAPRDDAAAAYDPVRKKIVMFGGEDLAGKPLDETWEWDGTTWTQAQPTIRPTPRYAHGLAYDPERGVVVLHGGDKNDTWEYDGTTWHDVTPTNVTDRAPQVAGFAMAYDRVAHRTVIYGGATATNAYFSETWGWNGSVWKQLSTGGPSGRITPAMVADPIRGELVLFGGAHDIPACGSCYVTYGDSWRWNGTAWASISVSVPTARSFAASAFDSLRGRLVVFGGLVGATNDNQTWELDGIHWNHPTPASSPPVRYRAAMAFDAAHGTSVLYGGMDAAPLGDTWTWDGTSWSHPLPATSPGPRTEHMMAYDVARKRVVLFGGYDASFQITAETWEWDGSTWTRVATTGPGARLDAVMGYDPIRQRVVLTSGDGAMPYRDVWTWDGTTWTELSPVDSPPPRSTAGLAWNAARRGFELFGGARTSTYDDTWELVDGAWTEQFPAPMPARSSFVMGPLQDGSGVVAFSGAVFASSQTNDLWQLRWTTGVPYESCGLSVDDDGDGLAGCADPDCWATCTPLCPPGATCDPSWPHCGDGTCSALENCRNCPQDCTCAAACGDAFCDPPETHATCPGDCP